VVHGGGSVVGGKPSIRGATRRLACEASRLTTRPGLLRGRSGRLAIPVEICRRVWQCPTSMRTQALRFAVVLASVSACAAESGTSGLGAITLTDSTDGSGKADALEG